MRKYSPQSSTVTVSDGQTTPVALTMASRFAQVTVSTLPGASIKVNGEAKGVGSFTDNLMEGLYDIEVTLASHRPATKQIEVVAGVPQSIELTPTPIYGSLDVESKPMKANITINGKNYGYTPITIKDLLIGEYDVVLSKEGCATVTEHVTISENSTAAINATLPSGRSVTIATDKSGDEIFVDGVRVGVSPCTTELTFGSHEISAQRDTKRTSKSVSITQGEGAVAVRLGFGIEPNWSSSVTKKQRAVLEKLLENMVFVEGGTFTMGATSEQGGDAESDEKPAHQVTLSNFFIGKYEVTQAEWQAVMGSNPSYFKGSNKPVERVSWNDCQEFIKKLNSLTGLNFILPTEAQWEYAARGGNRSKGYKYSGSNNVDDVAWHDDNSGSSTHEVGTKMPNELGLYDMSGNVWEWCSDRWGSYRNRSQTNHTASSTGSSRVLRGSSWYYYAWNCRVSRRISRSPDNGSSYHGLRLALASQSDDKPNSEASQLTELLAKYEKNPENTKLLKEISKAYHDTEDYVKAAEYYQKFVDSGEGTTNDLLVLSQRYLNIVASSPTSVHKETAIANAIKYAEAVNEKVPNNPRILFQIALCKSMLDKEYTDGNALEPLRDLITVLDKDPNNKTKRQKEYIFAYRYNAIYYAGVASKIKKDDKNYKTNERYISNMKKMGIIDKNSW